MRGLLLRDYNINESLSCQLLFCSIIAVFVFAQNTTAITVFLPFVALMASTSVTYPSNGLDRDELVYSITLPYSRSQLITVKYLEGLFILLPTAVVLLAAYMVRMAVSGENAFQGLYVFILLLLAVGLLYLAVYFPCSLLSGRMAKIVVWGAGLPCLMGGVYSVGYEVSLVLGEIFPSQKATEAVAAWTAVPEAVLQQAAEIPPAMLAAAVLTVLALYALSWRISVAVFRRMEL